MPFDSPPCWGILLPIMLATLDQIESEANAELAAFLAGKTGLKPRDVIIESGTTSPLKRVRLIGISANAVKKALEL